MGNKLHCISLSKDHNLFGFTVYCGGTKGVFSLFHVGYGMPILATDGSILVGDYPDIPKGIRV